VSAGSNHLFEDASLTLAKGHRYGLLGPNGQVLMFRCGSERVRGNYCYLPVQRPFRLLLEAQNILHHSVQPCSCLSRGYLIECSDLCHLRLLCNFFASCSSAVSLVQLPVGVLVRLRCVVATLTGQNYTPAASRGQKAEYPVAHACRAGGAGGSCHRIYCC